MQIGIILEAKSYKDKIKYQFYNWNKKEFIEVNKQILKSNIKSYQNLNYKTLTDNNYLIISTILSTNLKDELGRTLPVKIIIKLKKNETETENIADIINGLTKELDENLKLDPQDINSLMDIIKLEISASSIIPRTLSFIKTNKRILLAIIILAFSILVITHLSHDIYYLLRHLISTNGN